MHKSVGCFLFLLLMLTGCFPDGKKAQQAVMDVLTNKLIAGWEGKNIDLYTSAFWEDNYTYYSDNGTPGAEADDLSLTDFTVEITSQNRLFDQYADLKMELRNIAFVPMRSSSNVVQVTADYMCGLTRISHNGREYPRGTVKYTFLKRDGQWRISKWEDYPIRPEPQMNLIDK